MLTVFVRRPVLSAVISIILTLLGLLALAGMPMSLFPSIAPPEVNVTVEYTGANAETVIKAAIVLLERAINGVPGMKYMSSDAGNDGVGVVQILFEAGTDPDVAAIAGTAATADALFRAGQATYLEVLVAQQNTLDAELELIRALRDRHLARVRLYKALGGGWHGVLEARR